MPDITMCNAIKYTCACPMKDTCYRFKAVPNEYRQAYFLTAPFEIAEDLSTTCEHYSAICEGDRIREE